MSEFERVLRSKLEWYFSLEELLSGNAKLNSSILGSVYYWNSQLEKSST
jgi:hypothetical protein